MKKKASLIRGFTMSYRLDLTDKDTNSLESLFIKVTPLYSPLLVVPPPENQRGLFPFVSDELSQVGGFDLVLGGRVTTINQELHEMLLEQSLEEYKDIWMSLAQK
ncbi:MAG TPA: hypothetical protein G4O11_09810 [Anaerolineae bacterium]|nr:hypothetical protein [Anaerolineae bacterium]